MKVGPHEQNKQTQLMNNKKQQNQIVADEQIQDPDKITRWGPYLVCAYLYFLQGVVSSVAATMPYVYIKLPSYDTMSIFSAAALPFSFKFLIAPILQKYSHVQYGKRKFWIIISQLCCGMAVFISAFYTADNFSNLFAILCLISQIWIVVQDIALDTLVIKQLKSPAQAGVVQAYAQTVGVTLGGLILLKFTSSQFSYQIGLDQPIASTSFILFLLAFMLVTPCFILHFCFQETILDSQRKGNKLSIFETYAQYITFLKWDSKYFRTCLFFLIYLQGFNFFFAGYDYEMVKAGFSRNTMNSIENIGTIPQVMLTLFMGLWIKLVGGLRNSWIVISILAIVIFTYLLIFFPLSVYIVAPTNITIDTLWSFRLVITCVMINTFPVHGFSGMFITMLGSFANLGTDTTIHTKLCSIFGWRVLTTIGLGYQAIMLLILPTFWVWIQAGHLHIDQRIQAQEDQAKHGERANNQVYYNYNYVI